MTAEFWAKFFGLYCLLFNYACIKIRKRLFEFYSVFSFILIDKGNLQYEWVLYIKTFVSI